MKMSIHTIVTQYLLAAAVAPRSGRIMKNGTLSFERREDLLQNSIRLCIVG